MNKTPRLLKVFTTVYRCSRCHTWYVRLPNWAGLENGDSCHKCGCTSYDTSDGRLIGPKSSLWQLVRDEFYEMDRLNCFNWAGTHELEMMFEIEDGVKEYYELCQERAEASEAGGGK